jgi:cellulose synthase/poly-beta-1,6-N-acetylglucosamine synthase-like glycosyltransferase
LAHAHVWIEIRIDIGIGPLFVLDLITKYNRSRSGTSQHEPSDRFIVMIATLTLALSVYLAVLALGDIYLLLAHIRRRVRSLDMERADSVHAVVPPERLPAICVQLPVYNEPAGIAQAIDSLCALDWPPDRLEVLVLDDSIDETSAIAKRQVEIWARRGCNVRVLRRADRAGFKAGALQAALRATEAPYVAIFDVDYRPEPLFLRSSMKALLADPCMAFVQARLDFRNRDQNWLTRAQGLQLDTHLAYEQAARNWAGIPMMFNGTCGIWRRAAIEEAGGWSSRSLGEDQDLSFRAFARGWRCRYLLTVSVRGELPHLLTDLVSQRRRWSAAATQNLRVLPLRLRHYLNWHQTVAFLLLSQFNSAASILLIAIAIGTLATSILDPQFLGLSAAALLAVLLLIIVVKTAGSALARKVLGGSLDARYWVDVMLMWVLDATLLPINGMSFINGLMGRRGDFIRTPKAGI